MAAVITKGSRCLIQKYTTGILSFRGCRGNQSDHCLLFRIILTGIRWYKQSNLMPQKTRITCQDGSHSTTRDADIQIQALFSFWFFAFGFQTTVTSSIIDSSLLNAENTGTFLVLQEPDQVQAYRQTCRACAFRKWFPIIFPSAIL